MFRWKDGLLQVAVQLTGDDEDERLVTSLEFTLGEDTLLGDRDDDETPTERARRERKAENSAVRYEHTEPITLCRVRRSRLRSSSPSRWTARSAP